MASRPNSGSRSGSIAGSLFSESPGSETSDVVPTPIDNAAHYSFPFSIIRGQRVVVVQPQLGTLGGREKPKSLQERIPTFKSMMSLTSLREKHTGGKNSGNLRSDSNLSNGNKSGRFPSKTPSNLKTIEEGATLVWKDVTVTFGQRKEGHLSKAVQGVTGYARPGTILAVMGPPDSGNSTLLQALAGLFLSFSSLMV
jgi:ABC-type multidrug transport system fused ATPase/permease subunit